MQSISTVIRSLLGAADVDSLMTIDEMQRLYEQLVDALAREGYAVHDAPDYPAGSRNTVLLPAVISLRMVPKSPPAGQAIVVEMKVRGSARMTPVFISGRGGGPDVLDHYDVWLEGVTVPIVEGERTMVTWRHEQT